MGGGMAPIWVRIRSIGTKMVRDIPLLPCSCVVPAEASSQGGRARLQCSRIGFGGSPGRAFLRAPGPAAQAGTTGDCWVGFLRPCRRATWNPGTCHGRRRQGALHTALEAVSAVKPAGAGGPREYQSKMSTRPPPADLGSAGIRQRAISRRSSSCRWRGRPGGWSSPTRCRTSSQASRRSR